ncbi:MULTISPECIES: competence type IV pilus major pilin ComGC [Bacillaceae]|uniref:competence type IV pilus major pilin ComGC n=1 Tax=Bacillaceae TaxID=186817 RepID=UPI001E4FF996|nr:MULTISPECIES: competence type IV pilus major pilin ComGC [Bacillaceae]MCE4047063.1 prepilin-type N-terminal cleavage/methylation domain-containing protein [Bacillus sp. Au-Bac7]MCM3030167.1 prepilin-type N-terminal cleavage/methylation domain-containing protein [Niallia sp. MER 6]MDL0437442.1 competence type IV pilus major pilin ComGC [Niallia sp. SS-2023]UPO86556.1 prepilin-type N-terminal cleavage/methylation domain-containing protein [Niallia sp. Man26]
MKNESGFTLIEMMIVLLIISILLIITLPNITKHNSKINSTGCEAFVKMVEAEVQAYYMDKNSYPQSMNALVDEGYLKEGQTTCPNGKELSIENGEVEVQR